MSDHNQKPTSVRRAGTIKRREERARAAALAQEENRVLIPLQDRQRKVKSGGEACKVMIPKKGVIKSAIIGVGIASANPGDVTVILSHHSGAVTTKSDKKAGAPGVVEFSSLNWSVKKGEQVTVIVACSESVTLEDVQFTVSLEV